MLENRNSESSGYNQSNESSYDSAPAFGQTPNKQKQEAFAAASDEIEDEIPF